MIKYLLEKEIISHVQSSIIEKTNVLLFLDYDGTLAPFNNDPSKAVPEEGILELLHKLGSNKFIYASIISGRPISEVKTFIDISNFDYAGKHGLEIHLHNENNYSLSSDYSDLTSKLKQALSLLYEDKLDFRIEDKNPILTIHHSPKLNVSNEVNVIKEYIDQSLFEIMVGRRIIEIKPIGFDKKNAVDFIRKKILKENSITNYTLIYIGDDTTDEKVFEVMADDNISVYVKNESSLKTNAQYYVNNPLEVKSFLEILLHSISKL